MQKTRIICTIGPATDSYEMLQKLYDAGMSIARLNMSHGDHESHAKVIQHIKTLNRKVKFPIPILLDTQGPEIRTGDLSNELDLRQGDVVSVTTRGPLNVEESSIHINYADLLEAALAHGGFHDIKRFEANGVACVIARRSSQRGRA